MPSAEILDFAKLLEPIAGDNPVGEDMRADASPTSAYQAVRDARLANRAAERQQLADADAAPPDWRPVLKHGSEVLAGKSKDLEVAAYVTEALVRLHGFAGLRDGFRLTRELIERFWDGLFPLPDEDGLETRLAPLTGLNGIDGEGALISPILCVPLTEGSSSPPLACYHIQQALALEQVKDQAVRARRIQEGTVALDMVRQAVAETSRAFYAVLAQDLSQCQEEFTRLCQALDERCGADAPPASNIRAALAACREALEQVAGSKLPREEEAPVAPEGEANGQAAANSALAVAPQGGALGALSSADPAANRAEAFRLLLTVADYFRRTEPQSVVSYGLQQVVRWGRMSLPELLCELIVDDGSREHFFRQVGIREMEETSEAS